jgi:hypothetical protein
VRRPAFSILLLAGVTGCNDGIGPGDVAGSYALVAVNDAALPYLLLDTGDCQQQIDVGELQLEASGTYSIEFSGPLDCEGTQPARAGRTYSGTYEISGNDLQFHVVLAGQPVQFAGDIADRVVRTSVPPIPPAGGPDLALRFSLSP